MRAVRVFSFMLAGALLLTACGSSSASSGSSETASSQEAEVSTETSSTPSSNISTEDVVGIYVGENGSVLTFFDGGTASYYYEKWDQPETHLPWSLEGNEITWKSTILGCKVYADIQDADTSTLKFTSNSVNWDNEKYYKTTGIAKELTADECDDLISRYSSVMSARADAGVSETEEENTSEGATAGEEASEVSVSEAPEKNEENSVPQADTADTKSDKSGDSGLDPSFKEAMDSYVEFFKEYAEFMKTYSSSSSFSPDMLTEYADFLQKYSDAMEKLDAIDEDSLTPAEEKYYIDTMAEIQKILAEAAS